MGIGRPRYVALVSSKPNSPFETPGTNNFTSCLREEKGGGGGGGGRVVRTHTQQIHSTSNYKSPALVGN